MYAEHLRSKIISVVHQSEPLGPVDMSDITDPDLHGVLFESENKIYQDIIKHPSIVVGRRGSGKTTFLKSLAYQSDNSRIVVEIPTAKAFERVNEALNKSIGSTHMFSESIAELWDWIYWTSLLSKISKELPKETEAVMRAIGYSAHNDHPMNKILSILQGAKSDAISLLSKIISQTTDFSSENLDKVKTSVNGILKSNNKTALILLDSIEDYDLENENMSLNISGFLKSSGRFNQVRGNPEIRVCIPSEVYHKFRSFSSNSIKDFRHQILLHWHAGELLSLAAHRYRIFLNVNEHLLPTSDLNKINGMDIHKRGEAISFWRMFFPDYVTNTLGNTEDPIAYILRHTHLLPRHMIFLLNSIMRQHLRHQRSFTKISSDSIVGGIAAVEQHIWLEVCNAYRSVHPLAEEVVRIIVPELPLMFSDGDLNKVFNHHAKRILGNQKSDYYEFKAMLIEIGLIGAVTSTTDRYVKGVFEYTESQDLKPSVKTDLCLHPLYCGSLKSYSLNSPEKVIYPHGSDPEAYDFRDL